MALALTVLLGIAALVVDVGLSWAARAEAQTAADAAALAGAGRLAAGPAEAVAAVRQYLDANVPGLAGGPADPDWPLNGSDDDGEVVCSVRGTAVTLYLACTTYPTPCDALGAGFSLTADASYAATAPTDGPYANIALFSDRDNLTPLLLATTATGTIYARTPAWYWPRPATSRPRTRSSSAAS